MRKVNRSKILLELTEPQLFALQLLLDSGINSQSKLRPSYSAMARKAELLRGQYERDLEAAESMRQDMYGENGNG